MRATDKHLDDYAAWMCWALQEDGQRLVLREYRRDYGDDEADRLTVAFEERLELWNDYTEVQRNAYINRQKIKLRTKLNAEVV